jgi:hypothetical protein
MATAERLAELADILAVGILRLCLDTPAVHQAGGGNELVDFTPAESGREPRREAVGTRS